MWWKATSLIIARGLRLTFRCAYAPITGSYTIDAVDIDKESPLKLLLISQSQTDQGDYCLCSTVMYVLTYNYKWYNVLCL